MARYAGLWLDYSRALVIILTDGSEELVEIKSEIGCGEHVPGGICHNQREHSGEVTAARKRNRQMGRFFDQILHRLAGTEGILVMGVGPVRQEFSRFLRAQYGPAGRRHGTKSARRISGHDFYLAIRSHFAASISTDARRMRP